MLTYIIQHATVVTAPAIPQITSQSVGLDRVQRNYLIGRIGGGSGQNGQAAISSFCICARCSSVILIPMALINTMS